VVRRVPILIGLAGVRELSAQARRAFHPPLAPALFVQGSGFRVQGAGCRVQGSGFKGDPPLAPTLEGVGFRVKGIGCSVQDAVFRV